ncbi:BrnT family toxin [Candidatus Electronema sp. PJ]|uniref:BrnT family toxin n=1 Tax=Candidatus Electronema sp. PJ TaxID=3401572 RepID=UPI003AA968D3
MQYEWDEKKCRQNVEKHGIDFADVVYFDWHSALEIEDDRSNYGEKRIRAFGLLHNRLVVLVYTQRNSRIRLISLRKANQREETAYHGHRDLLCG